jgi:hypothetical protein
MAAYDVFLKGSFLNVFSQGNNWKLDGKQLYQHIIFRTTNQQRMVIKTNGNIGVGTSNPQAKLHIVHEHTAIRFERSGHKTYDIRQSAGNSLSFVKVDNAAPEAQNPVVLYLADTGNVGVNTVSPVARMHINGNFAATDVGFAYFAFSSTSPSSQLAYTNLFNNNRGMMLHNGASTSWDFLNCINDNGQQFKVKGNGKVYAREFLVTLENPFPDYVFEENKLRSIEEVAEYIKQHKHLPGIISAKQLEDDNKVAIGELQRQMLEKMEEMMLYIIELKNENTQLKAKLEGYRYEKN